MKYGFIGCGNMGGAIARALRKATDSIMISDPSPAAQDFAAELGLVCGTNAEVVASCERIFIAVKPQLLETVLQPLQPLLSRHKPLLISMAAGVQISKLLAVIGCEAPVIRIMPNTPVAVGKGMITYCTNDFVTQDTLQSFLEDMHHAGKLDAIPEKLIDAASALSGCGPAFMYMFIEALADGAVACGLPRANAMEYAAMTMAGAAEMVLKTNQHPGALKDAVCSPGGSTIAGVKALEENGFRGAAMQSVIQAFNRTVELGK